MLERARRLSDDEGLRNVTYELADAQVRRLRATVGAHHTGRGVLFDARAWIITAVRW